MDRETIRSRARELDLQVASDAELEILVAVVEGNETTFHAIDRMELKPDQSPFAFLRSFAGGR